MIEGLVGRFPALANITDLTAQSVTTVVLKRMHGQARWTASNSLRQHVLAAASEANAEKALGLLAARYAVTDTLIRENPFSQEVDKYLKSGMAQVEEMKALRITGSRTVALELTTTARVKPKLMGLLTSGTGTGLNVGMLWFNVIALKAAYNSLQKSNAPEYTLGFAASIFGVIGAAAAAALSARATQSILRFRLSSSQPGVAFGNAFTKLLESKLFARLSGYPAILLGLYADREKSKRQEKNGDAIASKYTRWGGITVALGSVLILEGSLAITGSIGAIPFAGWAAAGVVLLGGAILAGGVHLHAKASERLHTPLELWAARCIFGTKSNDGELRDNISLDPTGKLPAFPSVTDEVIEWQTSYYQPVLLETEQAKALQLGSLSSEWKQNNAWSPALWVTLAHTDARPPKPSAEFTVLLKEFIVGESEWFGSLSICDRDQHAIETPFSPDCYITALGLVLNFKIEIMHGNSASLFIKYSPNQGLYDRAHSTITFKLER
ncbi:hypothetical protein F3J44_27545 [Pantoea sp. Tr-811]|nr:hypothetical protein [Pantoea sp. Tr-811]